MEKFNLKTLKNLSPDERRAVAAMIIRLYKEQDNPANGDIFVVGDYAQNLAIRDLDNRQKTKICEQLVQKGIFCRQAGNENISTRQSQPSGKDNWYTFDGDFIEACSKSDGQGFKLIGDFIYELENLEVAPFRRDFYTFAATGILESTYL